MRYQIPWTKSCNGPLLSLDQPVLVADHASIVVLNIEVALSFCGAAMADLADSHGLGVISQDFQDFYSLIVGERHSSNEFWRPTDVLDKPIAGRHFRAVVPVTP